MPGLNGVDGARRLMAMAPAAKVNMLSVHQDEQRVVKSIRAGASGYLMKDVAVAEVATAIDSVLRGEGIHQRKGPQDLLANACQQRSRNQSTGTVDGTAA